MGAAAFAPAPSAKSASALSAFSKDSLPGAIAPTGLFDPLGFLEKADDATALRYREAEVTHGRVSMLAVIGFLVGEKVEGSSFLFDSQISGPAISHFVQYDGYKGASTRSSCHACRCWFPCTGGRRWKGNYRSPWILRNIAILFVILVCEKCLLE